MRLRIAVALHALLALASCRAALAQTRLPAPAAPRNVVLIVADDHGQDTGAYGNPAIRTPHLDRLAAEGTLYRDAFATTASCSPSRAVLLTGLHSHRNGQYGLAHAVHHFRSHERLPTLPVLLAGAGYRTARIGKFHVEPESAYRFQQALRGSGRSPVEMAESARAFVAADPGRPFFLLFATDDPHRSGESAAPDGAGSRALDEGEVNAFGNRPRGYPGVVEATYSPDAVVVPPWLPDTPATRAELAQYYQSVSRVDQGVGRLVQVLKEAGVYESTLIIYLSDHGAPFPGAKTTTYEPGLRSPLIVRAPGSRGGVRSDAMISWVDVTPTILEWAGVTPPTLDQPIETREVRAQVPATHGLHGRSFLATVGAPTSAGWDEVYASHTFHEVTMYYPMRVVRGRRYKLIWNLAHALPFPFASDLWAAATWQSAYRGGPEARYGGRTVRQYLHRPEWELYDLERDPHEARNLADDPGHARVLDALKERILAFQRRTSDPWLIKRVHP